MARSVETEDDLAWPMGKQFKLLLCIDLALVRQGIRALLSRVEDVELVAEAATPDEAVRLAGESRPDVVLLDEDMPGDILQAARAIKEAVPEVEIIMMTSRLDDTRALKAIEAGATGYVLKDIPVANLIAAVRAVSDGRAFFHPDVTRKLVERLGRPAREGRARMRLESEGLTARELDTLMELARGSTDREIAAHFGLAEETVKTHVRHILRKLAVRNRTQAVAYVLRKGLID